MSTDNSAYYSTLKVASFVGLALVVALADQFTKMTAVGHIESSFSLVDVRIVPPEAVFGPLALLAAVWASIVVRKMDNHWPLLAVPLGLVVGGALSNTCEAAVQGAVTDFIRIGPIATNVADLAMIEGVLSLFLIAPYIYIRLRCEYLPSED